MVELVPPSTVDGKVQLEDKSGATNSTMKRPAPQAGGCRIEGFVRVKKVLILPFFLQMNSTAAPFA